MTRLALLPALLVLSAPAIADAHIQLMDPLPRTLEQKQPHCGSLTATRSANPTVYEPGQTITVRWMETINHTGHYRLSFDVDGEDFTLPLSFTDTTQSENVLVDLIPDASAVDDNIVEQQITLPDIECETCTLQLIQMMVDASYDAMDDIYWQCADIALRRGGGPGPGPDAGVDDGDPVDPGDPEDPATATGGCDASGGGSAGIALLVLAIALTRRGARGASAH